MPSWAKAALDGWCHAAGIKSGPIFMAIRRGDHVQPHRMTAHAIHYVVTEYAGRMELTVAPHDLRRTFAKLAHKGGSPVRPNSIEFGPCFDADDGEIFGS